MSRKQPPKVDTPFAQTLRALITETRWQLAPLAERAKISRQTLYNMRDGRHIPNVQTLDWLAGALASHPHTGEMDPPEKARIKQRLLEAAGSDAPPPDPVPQAVVHTRYPGTLDQIARFVDQLPNQAEADRLARLVRAFAESANDASPLARRN